MQETKYFASNTLSTRILSYVVSEISNFSQFSAAINFLQIYRRIQGIKHYPISKIIYIYTNAFSLNYKFVPSYRKRFDTLLHQRTYFMSFCSKNLLSSQFYTRANSKGLAKFSSKARIAIKAL